MSQTPPLYELMTRAEDRRERIRQHVKDGIQNVFPLETDKYTLEVEDFDDKPVQFSPSEQKAALLEGKTLVEPLRGNVVLKDKATGKVIDRKKRTLAHLPYFTERHTFVVGGNDYVVSNQMRIKPGVYTRMRENGQLEAAFNLAKGRNFRLEMDPEKGIFFMQYGTTRIPLYPILKILGVSDTEIARKWNTEVRDLNRNYSAGKEDQAVRKLYDKIIPQFARKGTTTHEERVEAIKASYTATMMDPNVTELTLGQGFSSVEPRTLLRASQKLLNVYNEKEEQDDRDSTAFKTLHTVESFFKERIEKDAARDVRRKVGTKLRRAGDNPTVDDVMPHAPFSKSIHSFLTTSALSSTPMQINPMEIIDHSVKVTSLGEGGISSTLAVPDEARDVHYSHMGLVDPVRTPESGKAGIDVRTALHTARDADGNMYAPVRNVRTGKMEYRRADELAKKVVAFPTQNLTGRKNVDAMVGGQVRSVKPGDIDYEIPTAASLYSPTTNLVPFLNSAQGNRNIMGSKMQTQALPLKEREAPYVQVRSWSGKPGRTVEREFGEMTVPVSPVSGTVAKIDKDFIYIRPDGVKTSGMKLASDELVKVPYAQYFPMMSKTYVHDELKVKEGDKVGKKQVLADNNFTRDGALALGKNLSVGYMPYYGYNSNDAVVISETAAKKLTSLHMYKEGISIDASTVLNRDKHKAYYGTKYDRMQYDRLDERGVIKKGQTVHHGDLVIAAMTQAQPSAKAQMLGNLHKSLVKPYRDSAATWSHHTPGIVEDVAVTPRQVTVTVRTEEQMGVGDKMCFDAETEVLTSRGWIPVADVTLSDEVCTLQDGDIVYTEPDALHAYPEGGAMYRLQTQQLDQFVTANHSLYVQRRGQSAYELLPARDVLGQRVRFKKDGVWRGESPKYIELPALQVRAGQGGAGYRMLPLRRIETSTFAVLLGAYLSEGNIVNQPTSGSYGIDLTQIKEPHRGQLLQRLTELDIPFTEHGAGSKVRVYSKQLMRWFQPLGKAWEKYIPAEVFSWHRDDLEILFTWLMWGDGHVKDDKPISYTTTSSRLADDMQRLCLHIGKAANIKVRPPSSGTIKGTEYEFRARYDVRIVNKKLAPQINHSHVHEQTAQTEEMVEHYAEPVYCVTVPGHVLYVRRGGKPCWSGNSGRYGNKGVVSKIVPDDQMVKDEAGKPIDVLMTSAGIITRINPSQVIETAIGKVAEKTGEPIVVDQFADHDNVQWAKDLMKKHGVKDKETVFDPVSGKNIPNIHVGRQYIYKLFKSTDTNYAARGIGPGYDANLQPSKGGDTGAKSIGKMEFNALIAHNARNVLQEAASVKSQRNDEYWRRVQLGLPTPAPSSNFAYDKFNHMLHGAGIKLNKEGTRLGLAPLTDRDIDQMATKTVKNPLLVKPKMVQGIPQIAPERGGLFDPVITGGIDGNKYSKIELAEPVVNPVFVEPARRLLELSGKDFEKLRDEKGATEIKKMLNALDLEAEEKRLREATQSLRGSNLNDAVKRLKYIQALKKEKLRPGDAYVLSKIPVTPPSVRPVVPNPDGTTLVSDANYLYRDVMLANEAIQETPEDLRFDSVARQQRQHLHAAVGALFGTNDPVSPQNQGRGVKGHLTQITGTGSPKSGFFQSRLMKRRQDLSGRATIAPDHTLDLDQIGVPEDMAWSMYEPFLVKRLIGNGYQAVDARKHVQDRTPAARRELDIEIQKRPVMLNRAPTLHRYNMISAFPRLVPGKTVRLNPFAEAGMNADYDGDTVQLHVPVADAAVNEAKGMTLSNLLFGDRSKDDLMVFPAHEALIGAYMATKDQGTGPVKTFKTKADAMAAYKRGEITMSTRVKIGA